jgi:cold shock CspA family protein/ribosome-associated translation inhibitor RaiA
MQIPLQITFHQMALSPALEDEIRCRADELELFFDRIVSCRVSIEGPPGHHHQGGLYRVHIGLGVPGEHIEVDRSPEDHASHADAYVAIRDAFRAARRKLEDHVRRARGDGKAHVGPPHARVVHLEPDLEHGRLATDDGREIYFHRHSVIGGIGGLKLGAEVRFHEETGDKGPQASSVDPVGEHGHHTV